jgi:DNA-binding response OmpR family regulator
VLVVDDEHYIVDLLADLLEEEGYRVDRAYDGIDALEAIERRAPDVVVADVMMPRLDGLSFVSRLRERGDPIPVVLMSAAVTPRNPGVAFVAKPFDIDHMLSVIAEILQGRIRTGSPDLCLNQGISHRGPGSPGPV